MERRRLRLHAAGRAWGAIIPFVVVLLACGHAPPTLAPAAEPTQPAALAATPEPIAATEPPADPPAGDPASSPAASVAADVPSPSPSRTCGTTGAPIDPRQALLSVGNVHVYLEVGGWHASIDAPLVIEERVVEAGRCGRYAVARVERRILECRGTTTECEDAATREPDGAFLRVSVGGEMRRVSSLASLAMPHTQAEVTELLRDGGELEIPRARGRSAAVPLCLGIGCARFSRIVHTRLEGGEDVVEALVWPGVGLAAWSRQDYSAETGDGRTVHRTLLAFSVEGPIGPLGALGPEPAELTSVREAVHAIAVRGDAAALAVHLLSDDEGQGTQVSLSPEDRWSEGAVTAWAADGGLALSRLAAATAEPCAAVGVDVVCPRAEAERMARAIGCEQDRVTTVPRAMFVRASEGWRLAAMLSGGDDDVLYASPSAEGPALPYSMRASSEPD